MVFEPRNGLFKRLCTDAARDENRHFFLVVDEINRGDVPRIFGELITVIEHDKRNLPITLPLTGSSFFVPGIEYKISQVARFWLSQVTRQGRQSGHAVACRQAMAGTAACHCSVKVASRACISTDGWCYGGPSSGPPRRAVDRDGARGFLYESGILILAGERAPGPVV